MKNKQTMQEKRQFELEALNNALNHNKNEVEVFKNAFIRVTQYRTKRPYHLIFKTSDDKYLGSSCECDYMEMNAFIHGFVMRKEIEEMEEKLNN